MIENFEKLDYNRKVDVLVAMYVFGRKDIKIEQHVWEYMGESGEGWIVYYPTGSHVPCYSTLLTSAWDIVRKFNHMLLIKNVHLDGVLWQCKLGEVGTVQEYSIAKTEQLAICYAGLKAVGFDLKSFLQEEGKM